MTLPRILVGIKEAAELCGVCPATFRKLVDAGRLPGPVDLHIRRRLWSRAALERAVEGKANGMQQREDAWRRARENRQAPSR